MLSSSIHLVILLFGGIWATRPPPAPIKGIAIKTSCSRESFHMKFDMGRPFKGIVFAKEFLEECHTKGNLTQTLELNLPTYGCGVRAEPQEDGTMELSVKIVVQMDGKLRQSSDLVRMAKCKVPANMMSMNLEMMPYSERIHRNARMKALDSPLKDHPHPLISRIRVWLELGGKKNRNTGAVEVGEATTLGIRALLPGSIGVRVVDCSAMDGIGETSQKLLDGRGCPVDVQVMPALLTRIRPADVGWSKPHKDDLVEKLFQTTFPAFKFPDRERLHVTCGVQLCKGKCPKTNCNREEIYVIPAEKLITRLEVYNSLGVTAPQIDLQSDRRYNVTVDEYKFLPPVRSDGTLCLSSTKLAWSFCILGLIFLVAVIVSLYCLMRHRDRQREIQYQRTTGTSIFSTSSSSHSRFGSKLLIPYGGSGTLPYGRVY